ncbi:AbrB/MazE/SpoVT family DNA-binding domain-containing protein [Jiangella alkaliphila]|uniref:Looped-hinge helix DNA binding domain-containing protein, AbrB family n=1 Tax=Jiangella alkaliphila TaxID=419479 RepID=A0A1H2KVZ6_9ACTN|nr:AbrB/MazE/SpoVT family DNA-binding domain-containing protein [Jiangella alkaliphila]SDU72501.1 looped-hinge helix DNA binding domain-containing protein, AbrB family [Jiangella alkaliphila]
MTSATMTTKGQITIPKQIRKELGLVPGARVTFTRNEDGDYVLSRRARSVTELKGRLRYTGEPKTLDEMDAGIARGATESP